LHLVGILFPHIKDDARSKSLQTVRIVNLIGDRLQAYYKATVHSVYNFQHPRCVV